MRGIAHGFVTTLGHLLRPAITERYPYVKRTLPERSRSGFVLVRDEDGALACKACQLCARECPEGAIEITSEKPPEGGGRVLTRFSIDLGRCMFCGLCVEGCTSSAIAHTGDFEHASPRREALTLVLYEKGPRGASEAAGSPTESEPG